MYSIPFLVYILKKYLKNNSGNQYLIFSKRKSQTLYCIRLKIHKILVLKFIILLKFMSGLSVAMKRKSIEKVEPILPKTLKIREPSANGRTVHQNFKPAEVLKEFRKKQLYTYGNLSTQKSLSNLNTDDLVVMKQSRFDDDHHNTESIEQLLDTKMISNLPSSRTKKDQTNKKSISNTQENLTPKKQSFQSQDFEKEDHQMLSKQKQELKQQKVQEPQQSEKEGQNYDDYVLGDKIEIQQEQDQMKKKSFQKYATNLNSGDIQDAESIARADYIHFQNQRKRLTQLKEDQEIISLMQQYKNNKQILINQSTRKHQTHRIMASIGKAPKIQKSFSLPFLKPKREVEVPEVQQRQYDKTKRNLLGRDVKKSGKFGSSQLIASLSSGKLGFGRKKIRTICEQDIYEDEMNSLQNIKSKLRSKGIIIDTNKLTKGLVNIKNELQYQKVVVFPEKNIPSNPIYKKFPL